MMLHIVEYFRTLHFLNFEQQNKLLKIKLKLKEILFKYKKYNYGNSIHFVLNKIKNGRNSK